MSNQTEDIQGASKAELDRVARIISRDFWDFFDKHIEFFQEKGLVPDDNQKAIDYICSKLKEEIAE